MNWMGGMGIGMPRTVGLAGALSSRGAGSGVNQGSLAISRKAASVSGELVTLQS
jgi:hypothetical protein